MGQGMSRNIAAAGLDVRAWNRSRDKAEPLESDGITVVNTPAEAVEGADAVITMLADGDAVLETIEQVLPAAAEGTLWLQTSTIGETATARCQEKADKAGLIFVDAPVLGTKQPAEEGKLVVLASGPDDIRERAKPVFDAIGQRTLWVGEAGQASRLKLVVNVWIVSVVEGAAEALALAEGLGVDPKLFLDAISGGTLDMPYLQMKGGMMIERSFDPSFRLTLAAKDARLAARAAEAHDLDLPMIEAIAARMTAASEDHGDEDMSATFLASAPTREQPTAAR